MRTIIALVALIAVLALLPVLGGSSIWYLGGAHQLDIAGVAEPHGGPVARPAGPWAAYGGDPGGHRFSALEDISPETLEDMREAWVFRTGDLERRPAEALGRSAGETTPIFVEDKLVFCTPFNEVIAVDPGTGEAHWRFDPQIALDQRPANQFVCRGVAHWADNELDGACASRILSATNDGRLLALDAQTGAPCTDFGRQGQVGVDPGMDLVWAGEFQITSPPVVIGDIVIVGSAISDNVRVAAPRGTVRAYDVRSGALAWTFDPIPRTADAPNAPDWQGDFPPVEGHANAWAPMSVDLARGLIFVPTSSPSPDFFGGLRPGDNRYANSVVALDGQTGQVVWSFQTVHHDVWDYDVPAQPGLYTIWKDGAARDVVAQVTKTGFVFVLDRETGEPVLPVEERAVPQGGAAGEYLSPTQPFPVVPPPIVPDRARPADAFGITWFDKRHCAKAIRELRSEGLFTPPTQEGTLFMPFTGGGANWGGAAFDPARNLLVVNMSNLAHEIHLVPAGDVEARNAIEHGTFVAPQAGAPFGVSREALLSPLGLPCTPPPWGVLAGVDIATGEIVWRRAIGTTEDLAGGLAMDLGTPTLGGPIVTAGGLIFIGSTLDHYLRAFDVETGAELWKGRLPAPAIATPMTYSWQGRQYVAVFAGGHSEAGTKIHDSLVAFAVAE